MRPLLGHVRKYPKKKTYFRKHFYNIFISLTHSFLRSPSSNPHLLLFLFFIFIFIFIFYNIAVNTQTSNNNHLTNVVCPLHVSVIFHSFTFSHKPTTSISYFSFSNVSYFDYLFLVLFINFRRFCFFVAGFILFLSRSG